MQSVHCTMVNIVHEPSVWCTVYNGSSRLSSSVYPNFFCASCVFQQNVLCTKCVSRNKFVCTRCVLAVCRMGPPPLPSSRGKEHSALWNLNFVSFAPGTMHNEQYTHTTYCTLIGHCRLHLAHSALRSGPCFDVPMGHSQGLLQAFLHQKGARHPEEHTKCFGSFFLMDV